MAETKGHKKIGHYQICEEIGQGSYSKVKRCIDIDTDRVYAVKIMDKELLAKEQMEQQLFREVAIMKRLDHVHVVKMQEVMQTVRNIYIVMELMPGGNLLKKIQQYPHGLPEELARFYFQQLIVGLSFCHHQGIAHRDLKPENLLLDDNGTMKIADFGLANLQRATTSATDGHGLMSTLCGTVEYTAPEVLAEKPYNGLIADVWSCGVVLYVMATGRLPFDNQNDHALQLSIVQGRYETPRNVSAELVDLIQRLLTLEPESRPRLPDVAAHTWFSPGFDHSQLVSHPISVTSQDIERAITQEDTKYEETPLDALGLIDYMLQASFCPLVSGTQGMAHGQTRRYIMYRGTTTEAVDHVTEVLFALHTNPKAKGTQVKGFMTGKRGLLTFIVYVSRSICDSLTLLELCRGRGDGSDFDVFFNNLSNELAPKSSSTPVPLPAPSQ